MNQTAQGRGEQFLGSRSFLSCESKRAVLLLNVTLVYCELVSILMCQLSQEFTDWTVRILSLEPSVTAISSICQKFFCKTSALLIEKSTCCAQNEL